jgi:integrase
MARAKRGRAGNGESSIYKGSDGVWHGRVTVGIRDDGRADRRHVRGMAKAVVVRKVRKLEQERDAGTVRNPGRAWTVAEWLTHWVESIAALTVADSTLDGYRVAVNVHLIPGLGAHRIDRVEPEHFEWLYRKMLAAGSAPGNVHFVHRCARAAFNEAVRRERIRRNPVLLARPPRVEEEEIEPYGVEEVRPCLFQAAAELRNSVRWVIALALGLRQGEVLGLKWDDVDLDIGTLTVRRNRTRPKYRHGCGQPCGRSPGYCPQRVATRAATGATKSRAGRRRLGLPAELVALLRAHRAEQDRERETACQLWEEGGWVFTTPTGRPINPSTDYHAWKDLIARAGVRDARLHDARHTAATVLLILGVSERAVMGIMGWSDAAMAKRYQHVTDSIRHDVAGLINGLLWAVDPDAEGADGETEPGRATGPEPTEQSSRRSRVRRESPIETAIETATRRCPRSDHASGASLLVRARRIGDLNP